VFWEPIEADRGNKKHYQADITTVISLELSNDKKPGWVRPPLTVDESLVVSDATSDAAFCDFILLPLTEEEEEALVARRGVATTPITNRIQRDSLVPVCLITPTTTLLSHR
jgi:hypothetical protein